MYDFLKIISEGLEIYTINLLYSSTLARAEAEEIENMSYQFVLPIFQLWDPVSLSPATTMPHALTMTNRQLLTYVYVPTPTLEETVKHVRPHSINFYAYIINCKSTKYIADHALSFGLLQKTLKSTLVTPWGMIHM